MLRKRINELLNLLILNHGKNLKAVMFLDGFESRFDLAERNLGVNEQYFRNNNSLTIDQEPTDRIKTICSTVYGTSPFVAIVRNVYLIGGHHPIAVTSKFKVIYESIDHKELQPLGRVKSALRGMDFKTKFIFLSRIFRFFTFSKAKRIEQPAVLLTSHWTHYGHWLLEHFVKIRYIAEYQEKHSVNPVFILQNNAPKWQYDLLDVFNIQKEQIIQWNRTPLHIETFVLPSYPEWNFDDLDWLRKQLTKIVQKKNIPIGPRIYLSRKNCTTRIVTNEDELLPVLEKHGIQIIYPENYPVLDQIEIFMNATLVIGPHGSGFTNIIFSQNPIVVEFHGKEIRRMGFKLSKIMGFTYFPFYCDLDKNPSAELDKYLYVNPDSLDKLLTDVLA